MSKKMQKALQAFINEDVEQAKKLLRQVFIESAQKVNKELEEKFENEEEDLNEDVDQDPESDLTDEVGYKLDEDFGEWDDEQDPQHPAQQHTGAPVEEADESGEMSVEPGEMGDETVDDMHGGSDDSQGGEVSVPSEGWDAIQSKVDELTALFDQLAGGSADGEDLDMEPAGDEFGSEGDDDFADVSMGDEKFGESFKLKPVAEVTKKETEASNKKSPVAPVAKSPVPGVQPIKIKDGTVVTTDDKFSNSDALSAKVEDNNNVMDSAKGLMKDVAAPKNTAEKSRSPLPKNK